MADRDAIEILKSLGTIAVNQDVAYSTNLIEDAIFFAVVALEKQIQKSPVVKTPLRHCPA